jgi:ribosome-associated protein
MAKRAVRKKKDEAELLASTVIEGIKEKKGSGIVSMDLRHIPSAVCDFFIVCQGNSRTQVDAIAGSVRDEVKKELGLRPWHAEGFTNSEWILLDYGNVVVHVFQPEIRQFYNLEDLWADAEITRYE